MVSTLPGRRHIFGNLLDRVRARLTRNCTTFYSKWRQQYSPLEYASGHARARAPNEAGRPEGRSCVYLPPFLMSTCLLAGTTYPELIELTQELSAPCEPLFKLHKWLDGRDTGEFPFLNFSVILFSSVFRFYAVNGLSSLLVAGFTQRIILGWSWRCMTTLIQKFTNLFVRSCFIEETLLVFVKLFDRWSLELQCGSLARTWQVVVIWHVCSSRCCQCWERVREEREGGLLSLVLERAQKHTHTHTFIRRVNRRVPRRALDNAWILI